MKEEKLLKLMQVMSDAHWTFKGVVSTDELPVDNTAKEYYKEYYGNKFLMFKRIYSYKDNGNDFFKREYTEKFISLESDKSKTKDCFKEVDYDWHIPGPNCEWDEEFHITKQGEYGMSGCIGITGETLDTEQSWENVSHKLNEHFIFY